MIKMLKIFILGLIAFPVSTIAQSLEANWQCVAAIVEYTHVAREAESPEDFETGSNAVTVSWPSSAEPVLTRTVKEYAIGDTVIVNLVPLINPDLLDLFGVNMNVDLYDTDQQSDDPIIPTYNFSINSGSTYPTTEAENCSTYSTVPAVQEIGNWSSGSGVASEDDMSYTMGWGITLSGVFAQFLAADIAGGELGTEYGPGTPMENWGMVKVDYNDVSTNQGRVPTNLEIYWEANDGFDTGLGVNDDGQLNDFFGVFASPGDTVTIDNMEEYLAYQHPDPSLWYNLAWTGGDDYFNTIPMIGGAGDPIDPEDPETFTIDPATGEMMPNGTILAFKGYLFDPVGGDGVPFNGDEPLAPTGYFFTHNFMIAAGTFTGVLEAQLAAGAELVDALSAAATATASPFVLDEDDWTAEALGSQTGQALAAAYTECITAAAGDASQCSYILESGPTATLNNVKDACSYIDDDGMTMFDGRVDDSGYDLGFVDEDGEVAPNGRLVFEVDNNCIIDNTTQRVRTHWVNTGYDPAEIDESAPMADKFELMGNYPNPFNPETKIRFATERNSNVEVTIYSLLGEKVNTIQNGPMNAGTYNITWYGQDLSGNKVPSGVYFYEVRSDNRTAKGKMLLLK
ncbi:MAG: FlgD immunoglobulin-like domain containing protein [Candidatus Neomarinimicrobiota bacterium]